MTQVLVAFGIVFLVMVFLAWVLFSALYHS